VAYKLVAVLRSRFEAKLLVDYSPERDLVEVERPFQVAESGTMEPVSLLSRYYLAPSINRLARNYYPKPNWWVIDSDSEGIEFSACKVDGAALIIGRVWYQKDVVKNLQFVPKSTEFLNWAEAMFRYIKKALRYESEIYAYVGAEALKFRESGGQFGSGIRPDGKVISA
jgi:hypothetical protein